MAINYLNNVDFNRNELQDAQLIRSQVENQPNDAAVGGTPVEGQLYFNTTSDVLKIYGGGTWSEVGGGVISLTLSDGTYIDVNSTGTAANPVFAPDLNAVDGTAVAATRFLSKDNTWDVPAFPASDNYGSWEFDGDSGTTQTVLSTDTVTFEGGTKITTLASAGDILKISHDLQTQTDSTSAASPAAGATFTVVDSVTRDTTGHATGLNVKTITLPAAITVGDGQINGATSGLGISGSMSATANQSGDTTFTVASNASIGPTVSTLMHRDTSGYGYVVTPASGSSDTTIATTAWVQAKLTGLLEFKGGFNATSGELDDGSGNDLYTDVVIQIGDYYVVTTAGNFFGNTATPLTVGDSVIAQNAVLTPGTTAPVEGDFIVVQSDTDLATSTTVGLGNVNASSVDDMLGINVAYASGTAKVGLAISDLTTVATTADASLIPIFDEDEAANRSISVSDLFVAGNAKTSKTGAIAAGSLSGTVAHTFGQNTLVQTFDAGSGATVFCDVVRSTTTPYTITATISATQTNAITILVQKIG